MLAQTGGEIEKLTTDLKNLRQNEVNVQPNKLKNNHSDFDKNDSGLKINKENFDDDSSSDKEEEKVCDFDKESDTRDSHQGSSSEKENENSETSDVENNVTKREAAANFNDQDKEINVTCKNKDSTAFAVMYDVPSEKDQIESGESAEEDGATKNDHVPDNYESDGGNYNNHDGRYISLGEGNPVHATIEVNLIFLLIQFMYYSLSLHMYTITTLTY